MGIIQIAWKYMYTLKNIYILVIIPTTTFNLHPSEQKALKNLKADKSIVIAPADKGNATVVLDLLDYDRKIRDLLGDTDTY